MLKKKDHPKFCFETASYISYFTFSESLFCQSYFGSITFGVGTLIAMRCATKWRNLNNRGCLTHGSKNHETSATKWLNYKKTYSAHFGAEVSCISFSVGFHPRLLKYHPYQGDEKE